MSYVDKKILLFQRDLYKQQRDEILDSLKKSHNRLLQNDRGYAESNLYLINTKNIAKVESEK